MHGALTHLYSQQKMRRFGGGGVSEHAQDPWKFLPSPVVSDEKFASGWAATLE
jgi:hypothetical protein